MVERMRSKWCEDLEELLQCPVCYERPNPPIMQCERGHHICRSCKDQMDECPLCKSRFSGTRSYLAEELSLKLDDIKLSLINPSHPINARKRSSVSSQTDDQISTSANVNGVLVKRPQPQAAKGKFPCRIGACTSELPHGRMIPHIRYFHENRFHESSSPNGACYTQVWEMDYNKGASFDLALHISEMGLFFLNIKVNQNGDLYGVLQIVNSNYIGKQFNYELKIESGRRGSSFTGGVRSCRVTPASLYEAVDCLHISSQDMCRMVSQDNAFICALTLKRSPEPVAKKRPVNQAAQVNGQTAEHSQLTTQLESLRTELEGIRR